VARLGFGDPAGLAREATQLLGLDAILAAADQDGLAGDQRFGHLGARAFQDAAHCLTGDPHHLSRLFVAQALEIDEPNRLELVDRQPELLELSGRHTCRLEEREARYTCDCALNGGAGHAVPS
jgi:hypothetical protein